MKHLRFRYCSVFHAESLRILGRIHQRFYRKRLKVRRWQCWIEPDRLRETASTADGQQHQRWELISCVLLRIELRCKKWHHRGLAQTLTHNWTSAVMQRGIETGILLCWQGIPTESKLSRFCRRLHNSKEIRLFIYVVELILIMKNMSTQNIVLSRPEKN